MWPIVVQATPNPTSVRLPRPVLCGSGCSRRRHRFGARERTPLRSAGLRDGGPRARTPRLRGRLSYPMATIPSCRRSRPYRWPDGWWLRHADPPVGGPGTGEVWLGQPAGQSLTVRVADNTSPVVAGAVSAIPANVLLNAAPLAVAIRFSDNGPALGAATGTIAWGDGTTSGVTVVAPADPFTLSVLTTTAASHAYTSLGTRGDIRDPSSTTPAMSGKARSARSASGAFRRTPVHRDDRGDEARIAPHMPAGHVEQRRRNDAADVSLASRSFGHRRRDRAHLHPRRCGS